MKKQELEIQSIDFTEFSNKLKTKGESKETYLHLLKTTLEELPNFAIGPYYWFIPDNTDMSIIDSSDNIHELTPFKKDEWKKYYPNFFERIMATEDYQYFLGCTVMMLDFLEKIDAKERQNYKFSIYCRMEDKKKKLRWTIMNISKAKHPYYLSILEKKKIENLDIPNISRREREVLACIINGLKTPEIAEKLFISYHTVENHKRNLRIKTNCKTSGELVNFVLQNQLM